MLHPHKREYGNIIYLPLTASQKELETKYQVEDEAHAKYGPSYSIDNYQNNYIEYFDIENIPIEEKFHFGIVLNKNIVEIYLNGDLFTTKNLFGEPLYNTTNLFINNSKSMGGTKKCIMSSIITDFNYFRYSINSKNIKYIMNRKNIKENVSNVPREEEDHTHDIEITHKHKYDTLNEEQHIHNTNINPNEYSYQ
mgnify:CR=1 FL=1